MLPNVNQLVEQLRMLPDAVLQRVAQMYKQDPYVLPLVVSEGTMRKKMRMAGQARTAAPQPKVNDQAVASLGYTPEEVGIGALQAPNMARMADGGIAGYADDDMNFAQRSEPVVRMADGGVPRYQSGRMVIDPAVQTQRDKEAMQILLAELQTAKDLAAKGVPRAQADVAALEREIQGRIKRNPSLADALTAAIPIPAAQAAKPAPAAQPAAPATGRAEIPGTIPVTPQKEQPRKLGEKIVGAGETALSLLSGIPAFVLGGAQTAQQALSQGRAPTEQEYVENIGRFTYSPRGEAGQEMTGDVAKVLAQLPAYIPAAQYGRVARAARPAVAGAEADAAAAKVSSPRLEMARPGATRTELELAQARNLEALRADQRTALNAAERAAQASVAAERMPAKAAYAKVVPGRASMAGQAGVASLLSSPSAAAVEGVEAPPYSNEGRNYPTPIKREDATKEEKKEAVNTAKDAIPKKERKGFTNDDLVEIGLRLMADPGRSGEGAAGVLGAAGRAGLGALAARKEREKAEREEAKELSEAGVRRALTKKYETEAAVLESGTRGAQAALNAANTAFKNWEAGLSPLQEMNLTEEQRNAKYDEFLRKSFMALGLTVPAGLSSQQAAMPAMPQGVKVRQTG